MKSLRTVRFILTLYNFIYFIVKLLPFHFGNVISLKGRWSVIVTIIFIAMFNFRFTQPLLLFVYVQHQLTHPFPV